MEDTHKTCPNSCENGSKCVCNTKDDTLCTCEERSVLQAVSEPHRAFTSDISLCEGCFCMTHTMSDNTCGKCGFLKNDYEKLKKSP